MAGPIFTLGYEGARLVAFVDALAKAGVQVVVDVRRTPLSRKPGFSKSALTAALSVAHIGYVHERRLGCPDEIRTRYRADGDWSAYTKSFVRFLETDADARMGLEDTLRIAAGARVCLVCFEADHAFCHRSFVADALLRVTGGTVRHLTCRTETTGRARAA